MSRRVISTPDAPSAIGAYSQAVQVGSTVYISGQIPLDPKTMEIVDGDFRARTQRIFQSMKAIAEAAGGSLDEVVKVSVFMTDLAQFQTVNEVMGEFFSQPFPARAAVQVAALPKGVDVEADAVMELKQAD